MQTLSNNKVSILSGFLLSLVGRGGDTLNFKWQGWSKDFLGLKFLIPGFSWLRKVSKYFFGWLDGIFWEFKIIWRFLIVPVYSKTNLSPSPAHNIHPMSQFFCCVNLFLPFPPPSSYPPPPPPPRGLAQGQFVIFRSRLFSVKSITKGFWPILLILKYWWGLS